MKSKAEGEGLTPVQWVLLIQGSIAYAGFLGMLNDDIKEDERLDSYIEKLEDGRGSTVERTVQGVNATDERLIRLARVNTTILEEPLESKAKVEQTPFRCCSRCKFIGDYRSSCAVVPFGRGTGDYSDDCREFESKDVGIQDVETDGPESEIVQVAMEALNSSSLWQE